MDPTIELPLSTYVHSGKAHCFAGQNIGVGFPLSLLLVLAVPEQLQRLRPNLEVVF